MAVSRQPTAATNEGFDDKTEGNIEDHEIHRKTDEETTATANLAATIAPEEPDYLCGWFMFRPRFLQRFRTAKWVLFTLCWAGAIQGLVVNGLINVVITTIERRFGLRSSQSGLIASGYDIASFLCLIPVTYFGGRAGASKPRWVGIGVALLGLGSFTFALPHFLVGPYQGSSNSSSLCTDVPSGIPCTEEGELVENLANFRWLFFLAQLLHGAGCSPLYTLGVAFMDESVSTKMSSIYLGIFFTMAVVGPAFGYVLGGQMLGIYTDFLTVDPGEMGLTPGSNAWIGAWWIGFLVSAVVCFIIAGPLIAFPQQLPGAAALRATKVSEAHGNVKSGAFGALKDLPRSFKDLLSNPTFVFLNLAGASEGLVVSGFAAFLPKVLENQFSIGPQLAAILVGAVSVPAGGGGTFIGGYLVKRFRLHCSGIIKMCILTTLITAIFTMAFLLSCPTKAFAGVTQPYTNDSSIQMTLNSSCNVDCSCSKISYDPICGMDNVMYFSPCFAGCTEETALDGYMYYSECSCIGSVVESSSSDLEVIRNMLPGYEAWNNSCESSCKKLIPFMVFIFVAMLFTFATTMPALAATLRCVEDNHRSFALGIQWLKVRFLGTIPAPLIFGLLIDKTCMLWKDTCEGNGACLVFDNSYMGKYMLALAFGGKALSLAFFFFAWWFYVPPKEKNEEQELNAHRVTDDALQVDDQLTEMNGHVNYGATVLS